MNIIFPTNKIYFSDRPPHNQTKKNNGAQVVVVASDAKGNIDLADLKAKAEKHKARRLALFCVWLVGWLVGWLFGWLFDWSLFSPDVCVCVCLSLYLYVGAPIAQQ